MSFLGAPDIQSALGLRYSTAALVLFVLPQLAALLLEPPLYLLADRWPRKPFVVSGLLAMGAGLALCGLSRTAGDLAAAMALAAVGGGVGVNLAQATLMDLGPADRERLMARWALLGTLGDLATPALFAALAAVSLGWRAAFVVTGVLAAGYALALAAVPFPVAEAPPSAPPLRTALFAAVRNRGLRRWLLGVWLCSLLDELLVAFAALHLDAALQASAAQRSLVLACFVGGGVAGLALADRLLARVEPLRLLRASSAGCLLAYGAWMTAADLAASAALMAVVGLLAAPLYPIAQAQAYRALPGQSGLVNAAAALFTPLDLALPLALGAVADGAGLTAALALLAMQPAGLFLLARGSSRCGAPPAGEGR
ncbi:MAG TPA: MFS transporter [Vicinamibacteria bacterium]|nr:MFS transporter [Vicinamibacteria bacterium]